MEKSRKQYSPSEKIAILKLHLVDKMPISDVCDEYVNSSSSVRICDLALRIELDAVAPDFSGLLMFPREPKSDATQPTFSLRLLPSS